MCEHKWAQRAVKLGKFEHTILYCLNCGVLRLEQQLQASQAGAQQKDAEAAVMRIALEAAKNQLPFGKRDSLDEVLMKAGGIPENIIDAARIIRAALSTTAGSSILQRLQAQDEQIKAMRNCANCAKFGEKECQGDYKCYNQGYPYWQWKGGSKGE